MHTVSNNIDNAKVTAQRQGALLWNLAYRTQSWTWQIVQKYKRFLFIGIVFIIGIVITLIIHALQPALESHYGTKEMTDKLSGLVLNIGSALIGASAIVTSLVLFAMQVNIERMPYGLFYRLSADIKLLGSFAFAFLMAICIAALSTFIEKTTLADIIIASSWAILLILSLFIYAYRRALALINPVQQLSLLLGSTRKELQAWARRAQRVAPLIKSKVDNATPPAHSKSAYDLARKTYFKINKHWTDGAERSVRHAMSFARRYAEEGDHEVSSVALSTVVHINSVYITAKGRTFFSQIPLIESHLSTDGFINYSLECMRQYVQIAITRRDELQIVQSFQTLAAIVNLYTAIDYSTPHAQKTHAELAAAYLSDAVKTASGHDMPDVTMEGLRLMGQSARSILNNGKPNDILSPTERIFSIIMPGCVNINYIPVTREGVNQLAELTYALLFSKDYDIHYSANNIRENILLLAKTLLAMPSGPQINILRTSLEPYYSSTSTQSLRSKLTDLTNALIEAKEDNVDAQSLIWNIEGWAYGIHRIDKELFLASINAKSLFAFDIIYWIIGIMELLLAISNSPACTESTKEKLREHALFLISIFSRIPSDKDTVLFVENFQFTDKLFESAMIAHNRNCEDISKKAGKFLLRWSFKVEKYQEGWSTFSKGLCGLAVLSLMHGNEGFLWAKTMISDLLSDKSAADHDILKSTARELLHRSTHLYDYRHSYSEIDSALAEADPKKLQPLLKDIANLLLLE